MVSFRSASTHLGESGADIRRDVASIPGISAAYVNANEVRLPRQGIWLFFSPNQQVREMRLDAPFGGDVQGVHIGDTVASLLSALGDSDVPPFAFAGDLAYVYHRSGVAYRYDVGADARVERVFIMPAR
jgi:hypothetical protein